MRLIITTIATTLTLLTFATFGQEKKVLRGIAIDGYRNPILAINVVIKGTTTGAITDVCGEFAIPIDEDHCTLAFQGMSFDDTRTYEIVFKQKDITGDLLLFQLGNWEVKNDVCKKTIDRKLKRFVIE